MTSTDPHPQIQNSLEALMASLTTGFMIPEHIEKSYTLIAELAESEGHEWSDYQRGYASALLVALNVGKILGAHNG